MRRFLVKAVVGLAAVAGAMSLTTDSAGALGVTATVDPSQNSILCCLRDSPLRDSPLTVEATVLEPNRDGSTTLLGVEVETSAEVAKPDLRISARIDKLPAG